MTRVAQTSTVCIILHVCAHHWSITSPLSVALALNVFDSNPKLFFCLFCCCFFNRIQSACMPQACQSKFCSGVVFCLFVWFVLFCFRCVTFGAFSFNAAAAFHDRCPRTGTKRFRPDSGIAAEKLLPSGESVARLGKRSTFSDFLHPSCSDRVRTVVSSQTSIPRFFFWFFF